MFGLLIAIPYLIIALVHIYGERNTNLKIKYLTKPLLMPILILMYIFTVNLTGINWLIVFALLFGMLGDIFLMLKNVEKWFIFGMGCFLLNHILYIISFLISINNIGGFLPFGFFLFIPVAIMIFYLIPAFFPKLDQKLKIPVIVYMIAIITMHVSATLTLGSFQSFEGLSFVLVYIGSLSFIISDGLIVVDKFDREIDHANEIIMATYLLAQFFIVLGMILMSY